MFNLSIIDFARLILERRDNNKDNLDTNSILLYAILSEAKINNDLAKMICRVHADKLIDKHLKIFYEFIIDSGSLLLTVGVPARIVFGDKNAPNEESIDQLDNATIKVMKSKSSSELYEFYIRKCTIIRSLYNSNSLDMPRISLQKRCKNIEHATRILISRLTW